jgi:hypothetical protein
MTQGRRARDYSRKRDAAIRNLRRGDGTPTVVAGYLPGNAGRPRAHPGDEKFPFVKDPPDTEGPVRYIEPVVLSGGVVQNPIPHVTTFDEYLVLKSIDVAPFRLLTLFIEFFPEDNGGNDDGTLSIVPEQSLGDQEEWFPAGVVDGELTPSTLGGTFASAERRTFATQLLFNRPGSMVVAPDSIRETLDFDVTTKANFRFLVGDTLQTVSGLNLWYTLNR